MVNCYIFDGYDTGKPVISRVVENTPEVLYFPGCGREIGAWILGPVLYLLKKRYAKTVALVATLADFILMLTGIIFRDRISALGMNIFGFDIFILLITFIFWLYLFISYKKNAS